MPDRSVEPLNESADEPTRTMPKPFCTCRKPRVNPNVRYICGRCHKVIPSDKRPGRGS